MLEDGQKVEDIYSLNEKTNIVLLQKGNEKTDIIFRSVDGFTSFYDTRCLYC